MAKASGIQGSVFKRQRRPGVSVLICTPTAEGNVTTVYASSIFRTIKALESKGIETFYKSISMAEVSRARNILTSQFLTENRCSHLLFVDNDIGFRANLILRLLDSGFDFVGAACPSRMLDKPKIAEFIKQGHEFDDAFSQATQFNIKPVPKARIVNGFVEVSQIGTGLLLLHRNVFEQLIANKGVNPSPIDTIAQAMGVKENYYNFFEMDPATGTSEDYYFCRKYRSSCKLEIHACVDEEITHAGEFRFTGRHSSPKMN